MHRRQILAGLAASMVGPVWQQALAAEAPYPRGPIKFVVPFPPGGATDNTARLITAHLQPIIGQPCVIYNKGGANGRIGTEEVARSPGDGYTLLVGGIGPLTIAPHLEKVPYDPEADFTPISCLVTYDTVLIVNPSLPVSNVPELIAYIRSGQHQINFGSSGTNGPYHMAGELFKSLAKVDMTHVPYRGDGAAIIDLIAGHVQLMFTSTSAAIAHINEGRVKVIAGADSRRSALLPKLQTVAEQGVAGYALDAWAGLIGPRNMPPQVVQTLYSAVAKTFAMPVVREGVQSQGGTAIASEPVQFKEFLRRESAKWAALIRERHLKAAS